MINVIKNHNFYYETQTVISIFFLKEEIKYLELENCYFAENKFSHKYLLTFLYIDEVSQNAKAYSFYSTDYDEFHTFLKEYEQYNSDIKIEMGKCNVLKGCGFCEESSLEGLDDLDRQRKLKHLIKRTIFLAIKEKVSRNTPWGMLTGIRPTKKVYNMEESKDKVISILKDDYFVNPSKAELVCNIAEVQKRDLKRFSENSLSVYLDIPFCPTRCLYCSFTSNSLSMHGHMVLPYLEALKKEIEYSGKQIENKNLEVSSVYVGGGTPTSLSAAQLEELLSFLRENIKFQDDIEFTVEAGRPDTINRDKLEVLKKYGVNRISINPQTMNIDTLKLIGRNHTPNDIKEKYSLARDVGFDVINMDLIIGLPNETVEMAANTLNEIENLKPCIPDNLTVHTMALKRASNLNQEFDSYHMTTEDEIEKMINMTMEFAYKMGMEPYYLYRQKNMIGNMENIGYAAKGKICFYNVVMMDERQNILALGAGGVSKFIDFKLDKLERIYNVKGMYDYISRIDEMLKRKDEFFKKY